MSRRQRESETTRDFGGFGTIVLTGSEPGSADSQKEAYHQAKGRSIRMKKQPISESDCKRSCDAAITECEEGSVYMQECDNQWDSCMSECMSACEIYS